MFDFHEKRKLRAYLYSPLVVILLLILTGILSISVYERFVVEREMAERRNETERQLEELKLRATVLEEKVHHLKNDRGIEEEIRSRFDAVKQGEQVVIIVDEEGEETSLEELSQPPGTNENGKEKSWWQRLLPGA